MDSRETTHEHWYPYYRISEDQSRCYAVHLQECMGGVLLVYHDRWRHTSSTTITGQGTGLLSKGQEQQPVATPCGEGPVDSSAAGGRGKAAGFAEALPMANRPDHRQTPKTPLAAATRHSQNQRSRSVPRPLTDTGGKRFPDLSMGVSQVTCRASSPHMVKRAFSAFWIPMERTGMSWWVALGHTGIRGHPIGCLPAGIPNALNALAPGPGPAECRRGQRSITIPSLLPDIFLIKNSSYVIILCNKIADRRKG